MFVFISEYVIENDTLFSFLLFYSIWGFHVPGTKHKQGKNIQTEHKKYVYLFKTSFISEYVIWKWHIFQLDFIYSPENSKFKHFMSPGQSIKRVQIYKLSMFVLPKYHLFMNMWFYNDTFFKLIWFILRKIANLGISCPRDKA